MADFNALNLGVAYDFSSMQPGGLGYIQAVLKDEPILYYRFQETSLGSVQDYSGNDITGTSSGSINFSGAGPTASSSDFSYDFVDGFVTIPDNILLNQTFGSGFTAECWIKVGILPTEERTILSRSDGPGENHYQVALGADGRIKFWFSGNAAPNIAFSDSTLVINTWYHVVCVWNGTQNLVYLNAVAGTPVANTPTVTLSSTTGQVGAFNNGDRFLGRIDEVAIYDTALDQEAVDRRFAFDASDNTAPVIDSLTANGQGSGTLNIFAGESVTFIINATDDDADTLNYSFSPDGWVPSIGPQLSNTTVVLFDEVGVFSPVGFVTDGKANRAAPFAKIDVDPVPNLRAFGDSAVTGFRDPITVRVLNNDSFPVGGLGSISNVTDPPGGSTSIQGSGETATILYTPDTDFFGDDTFQYTITDGGTGFDTATVTVTVAEKQPPSTSTFSIVVDPDSTDNRFQPQSNDNSDPPGEVLTLISVQNPSTQGGTVTIDSGTNEVVYTPTPGYTGGDSFSYQIEDEAGLTASGNVSITVSAIVFSAENDTYNNIPYETAGYTMSVLGNDVTSFGFPILITGVTQPPVGEGTVSIINAGTRIEYVSNGTGFIGSTSFTYDIDDGNGNTDTATVSATVVNRDPIAANLRLSTNINTDRDLDVLGPSYDPEGGTITLVSFTQPSNGTTTLVDSGTPGDASDDFINYDPDLDFEGIDSFTYTIEDPVGNQDTSTVNVAVGFTFSLAVNQTLGPVTESFNFSAIVSASSGYDKSYAYFWDFKDGGTSTLKNPSHQFAGIGTFDVECTVTDSYGVVKNDSITVEVTANARPIANNISVEVAEGQVLNFDPRSNDSDPDGDLFFVSDADGTSAQGGTVSINNNATPGNVYDDFITYVHPIIATPFVDTFDYEIEDEFGLTASATVTVTVTSNQPPVAEPIYQVVVFERATDIAVLNAVTDPEGDDLYVQSTSGASNGSAPVQGSGPNAQFVRFTPTGGYKGPADFDYTARDTFFNTDQSTVTMSVFGEFYPALVASDNPISYWPMNEDVGITILSDAIDGTNIGLYTGNVPRTETGPLAKDLENAARFDAGNASVDISGSHGSFTDQFTLEFWIRQENSGGAIPITSFIEILSGGENWTFSIEASTEETILATGFEVDEWYHVVLTYDGEWARIYRDAEAISARELTGNIVLPTQLTFGNGVIGKMSDVALYNQALTPTQITDHYQESLGPVTAFKVQSNQDEVAPGDEFLVTVKGRDITDKTVKTDNSTVVDISSDGTVEFDANDDDSWGT